MALRAAAHLPRLVVLGAVFLFAGATLTYGAAQRLSAKAAKPAAPASAPTVVVPAVTGQAFVFAKGALEDAGFAWQVRGPVHGYAVNRVVTQGPAAGTKLKDTGAPTITVSLARTSYPETGEPEDLSPYVGTAVVFASRPLAAKPTVPLVPAIKGAEQKPKPAKPKAAAKPKPKPVARPKVAASKPAARPRAFAVRGAPKEPLKEMPL